MLHVIRATLVLAARRLPVRLCNPGTRAMTRRDLERRG
jgi:hypothetical protein